MSTAYINIGSNLGDRAALIERAVAGIQAALGVELTLSAPIESEPWGYESENPFLNVGASFATSLEPEALLNVLLGVQNGIDSASHRTVDGGYADRAIDIDLIAVDERVMANERLVLPHPAMHRRRFVLEPMRQLAPQWRHPLMGLTAEEMLKRAE